MRDHLRYVDEIVCAAARVVEAVREHARKNKQYKPSMEEGIYDAMHVRRGDFQVSHLNANIINLAAHVNVLKQPSSLSLLSTHRQGSQLMSCTT